MIVIQKNEDMSLVHKKSILADYRVYMTYFSALILVLTTGANMGWASPMVIKLNSTDDNPIGRPLTVDESSWMVSIAILGTVSGSLICGALGQFMGRKIIITIMGTPCLIFCCIMAFTKSVGLFLLARFLAGVSGGSMLTVVPSYFGEISKPEIRGRLFVFITVAHNVGTLITYSTAPFMTFFWYHICLAVLPITFLILFPTFALESPYYTIRKNRREAEETLKMIREKDNVTEEMNRMIMDLQKAEDMRLINVFNSKATRKALLIALGLIVLLMLSGNMTILSYTQFIVEAAGSNWSSEINAIVITVFQVFTTILSTTVTDRFGRKPLLIVSFSAVCISQITLGVYLMLKQDVYMNSFMKVIPLASLIVYVAASSFTSVAPSLAGEIFSLKAKHIAMAISSVCGGTMAFLVTFSFQRIQDAIGLGQSFLIFAAFAAIAVIFVITVMVETRGISLEQIQDKLEAAKGGKNDEKV